MAVATASTSPQLAATLADAFSDDPVFTYLLPDSSTVSTPMSRDLPLTRMQNLVPLVRMVVRLYRI